MHVCLWSWSSSFCTDQRDKAGEAVRSFLWSSVQTISWLTTKQNIKLWLFLTRDAHWFIYQQRVGWQWCERNPSWWRTSRESSPTLFPFGSGERFAGMLMRLRVCWMCNRQLFANASPNRVDKVIICQCCAYSLLDCPKWPKRRKIIKLLSHCLDSQGRGFDAFLFFSKALSTKYLHLINPICLFGNSWDVFFFFKVFIIVGLNDLGLQLMTILTNNLPIIFWDDIFKLLVWTNSPRIIYFTIFNGEKQKNHHI